MAGVSVSDLVASSTRRDQVRKWGTQLLAVEDGSAAVPSAWFDTEDHRPTALPATARILGFITTDGMVAAKGISREGTQMVQSLENVRDDITGIEQTLAVTFGQASSAWVNALYHGKLPSEFPAEAHAPWIYHDGEITDYPFLRLHVLMQDGVGPQAFYRYEYGYSAKIISVNDRTLNRTTAEGLGMTFGLFKDVAVGRTLTRAENGPGFGTVEQV